MEIDWGRSISSEYKERPKERVYVGDLCIIRKKSSEYYPSRVVEVEETRTTRWLKVEFQTRGYRGWYPTKWVRDKDCTLLRKDTLVEKIVNWVTKNLMLKKWKKQP